jgi:LacI family transcriptional regulator
MTRKTEQSIYVTSTSIFATTDFLPVPCPLSPDSRPLALPSMPHARHVALLIETSRSYGRGLLRGIIRYQREHGPWSIFFEPRGLNDTAPNWLKSWRGHGILARINDRRTAQIIRNSRIPAVDLRFAVPDLKMPAVGIDNETVVRRALDHFLDRGYTRFAFCSYPRRASRWMDVRAQLFQQLVAARGFTCEVFTGKARRGQHLSWEQDQQQLARWAKRLPKPIAVMACNDDRGLQLLDACRRAGIRVPDDVSVLGVDNDEFMCLLATPPLSSIDINLEAIGYRAAELLDSLMQKKKPPSSPVLLPAGDVIARQSTDCLAINDAELCAAVRYLREHACHRVRMRDVTAATGLERRTLERKMKRLFGRSPKDELLRIQIDEAKRLLLSTEMSIKTIALRTGFSSSRYFSKTFRDRLGLPPTQFRQKK